MSQAPVPLLDAAALARLAVASPASGCPACAAISSRGWESIPGAFGRKALRKVGTLRDSAVDDPTLQEHHPAGTNAWSPDAPIAPAFFPYNRCDVWQCGTCSRVFLRYTEYGGYYEEERIRPVDVALVTTS
jgi:hypothetical protein